MPEGHTGVIVVLDACIALSSFLKCWGKTA
jgi:hypothetical protein